MKKILLVVSVICLTITLIGCNNINERRAENTLEDYYQALIKEDYENAFEQLYIYEDDSSKQSSLSKEEAKKFYLEKIKFLKEENYKFKGYNITELEYEDGHSFWHHIDIEIEQNGETFNYKEIAYYQDGKLKIDGEDPYILYRDGKMAME